MDFNATLNETTTHKVNSQEMCLPPCTSLSTGDVAAVISSEGCKRKPVPECQELNLRSGNPCSFLFFPNHRVFQSILVYYEGLFALQKGTQDLHFMNKEMRFKPRGTWL